MKIFIICLLLSTFTIAASVIQNRSKEIALFQDLTGTEKIDSLNNYALNLGRNNPELRKQIGQKCLDLSKKENYELGLIQSVYNIGAGFFHLSDFDTALTYYKKSFNYAIMLNDLTWKMNLATNIGQVFSNIYQFDSANTYYNKGMESAILIKDTSAIGYLYNSMGAAYWKKGEFLNSIKYYKFGLRIHKQQENYKRLSRSLNSIGSSYWNLKNNILALKYYLQALEAQKHYTKLNSSLTLNNVALLYLELNDIDLAEKYINSGLESAKATSSILGEGYSYLNMGDLKLKMKKHIEALEYYEKATLFYEKLKDRNGIAQILNKIGEVYLIKKEFRLAEEKFLEAYKMSAVYKMKLTQTESLINLIRIQIFQRKNNKAVSSLKKAFLLAEKGNFAESKIEIYNLQSKVYKNLKYYKTALMFQQKHEQLKDSLFNENSLRILSDTKEKYESEKSEKANLELQHINSLQKLDLENKKNIMIYILLGTITFVFVIIYLVYLNRLRKNKNIALQRTKNEVESINNRLNKTNKLLQQSNSTKDKFFSIISHDLKNPFNTLLGATEILQSDFDKMSNVENSELIEIIANDSKKLYSLLENLLYWANSQTGELKANKTNIFLHQVLIDTYLLFKSSAESKNIDIEINVPKSIIVVFDMFMLSTIIRNLLSNAIKFTNSGGKIVFSSTELDGRIHLYVTDEGVGIKEENIPKLFDESSNYKELGTNNERGTGLGLILCNDFAKGNDSEIKVTSVLGKGTTFELVLEKGE